MKKQRIIVALCSAGMVFLAGCASTASNGDFIPLTGNYWQIRPEKTPESGDLTGLTWDVVTIDGKIWPLALPDADPKEAINVRKDVTIAGQAYKNFMLSSPAYRASQFGILGLSDRAYAFARGRASTTLPSTGKFIYQGAAALFVGDEGSKRPDFFGLGKSHATVDFGQKTMQVDITTPEADVPHLHFDAVIRGHSFEGDAKFEDKIISGGFYGDEANEIAGTFLEKAHRSFGVFGGKKQTGTSDASPK